MLTPFCLKSKLKTLQNSQKRESEMKLTKKNISPFLVILLGISDLLSLTEQTHQKHHCFAINTDTLGIRVGFFLC